MKKSFIFLTKSQLSFYGSNLNAVAVLDLTPALFQDMEIVNEEEFSKALTTFIETHKIQSAEFIQVLNTDMVIEGTVSLQKNPTPVEQPTQPSIPPAKIDPKTLVKSEENIQQEIQDFLTIVPFENTLQSINRKDKKNIKIYVINKNVVDTIKTAFESKGFVFQGVTALPLTGQNPIATLDPHMAKSLLTHYDNLKSHQFPTAISLPMKENPEETFVEDEKSEGSNSKTMVIVLSVLLIVLGGLGYIIWTQFNTKPKSRSNSTTVPTTGVTVISPTVGVSPTKTLSASSSATLQDSKTTIQVLNGSGIPGQADQIKSDLAKIGFTDITTGNSSGITLSKTLVVFKKSVPSSTRDTIAEILKKRFSDISVQETEENEFDVSITTIKIISPTPSPSPIQ